MSTGTSSTLGSWRCRCENVYRMRNRFLAVVSVAANLCVLPFASYLAVVTGAAWWSTKRRVPPERRAPSSRVLVIVPAHDEERLIGDTVRSLLGTDYPAHLRRVVVVADHCGDSTAESPNAPAPR